MRISEQAQQFARHYIRDMVYAAHDGVITTFAVVAGARGAELSSIVIIALGFANLVADGLSMGLGNYLGIKSERASELGADFHEMSETIHAARHGGVTVGSFALAGLLPLLPFCVPLPPEWAFSTSAWASAVGLFGIGSARTLITGQGWLRSGLEMLAVGALAGATAFLTGWAVGQFIPG